MYIEVELKNGHKHLEYFPKFNNKVSIERLKEVYRDYLVNYILVGADLSRYKGSIK